jgi:hypothetical protein
LFDFVEDLGEVLLFILFEGFGFHLFGTDVLVGFLADVAEHCSTIADMFIDGFVLFAPLLLFFEFVVEFLLRESLWLIEFSDVFIESFCIMYLIVTLLAE